MKIQHNKLLSSLAIALVMMVSVPAASAQQTSSYDLNKPFGWAVCTSLDGGHFNLCGGKDGRSITLKSNGRDMGDAIYKALATYDIVILDGSNGPFTLYQTVMLNNLRNKSLLGINDATLRTRFYISDAIKAKLDSANVRQLSTSGGGRTLSNGKHIHEAMEYAVRQLLIDYLDDPEEHFRNSGLLKVVECDNIIIRNIRFEGPGAVDVGGDDLLTATATTHLWVDHCDFLDGMDANFDINSRSDFITVSWCTFSYTDRAYVHMNTNLVGASDNPKQGIDNLNVTYANCIWGKGCNQRMPMARFGTIHVLNCLYDCEGNSAAANARRDCEMLLEGCYFEKGVKHPFRQTDAKAWNLRDNIYTDTFETEERGRVVMPYPYKAMPAKQVPEILRSMAGVRPTDSDPRNHPTNQ